MAAFMEDSGVEKRNGRTHRGGILRSHFKIIAFHQGPFAPLQFLGYQIRNCLFKQHSLVNGYHLHPAGTVTDDIVSKGGDWVPWTNLIAREIAIEIIMS